MDERFVLHRADAAGWSGNAAPTTCHAIGGQDSHLQSPTALSSRLYESFWSGGIAWGGNRATPCTHPLNETVSLKRLRKRSSAGHAGSSGTKPHTPSQHICGFRAPIGAEKSTGSRNWWVQIYRQSSTYGMSAALGRICGRMGSGGTTALSAEAQFER